MMRNGQPTWKKVRNWEIFKKHYRDGKTKVQLAEEYGISPSRIFQVLAKINRHLFMYEDDDHVGIFWRGPVS